MCVRCVCVCLCVYVCVCVCFCVCVCVCVCKHAHDGPFMYACVAVCLYGSVTGCAYAQCVRECLLADEDIRACVRSYVSSCVYAYVRATCVCVPRCAHTCAGLGLRFYCLFFFKWRRGVNKGKVDFVRVCV